MHLQLHFYKEKKTLLHSPQIKFYQEAIIGAIIPIHKGKRKCLDVYNENVEGESGP